MRSLALRKTDQRFPGELRHPNAKFVKFPITLPGSTGVSGTWTTYRNQRAGAREGPEPEKETVTTHAAEEASYLVCTTQGRESLVEPCGCGGLVETNSRATVLLTLHTRSDSISKRHATAYRNRRAVDREGNCASRAAHEASYLDCTTQGRETLVEPCGGLRSAGLQMV